jgi:hypothetical protein
VRFKGDFQGAIGRGHLRRGLLALVLKPKPHRGKTAVLATTGRLGHSRTLRSTSSKQVGVIRDGKFVEFYVLGGGLKNVSRIQVKAFARKPRARRRAHRTQANGGLTAQDLEAIKGVEADGQGSIRPPASPSSCETAREQARSTADRFEEVSAALETATGDARNKLIETNNALSRALTKELRPALARERCFKVAIRLEYHHHGDTTHLCGTIEYDLPIGVNGQPPELYRRGDDGVFVPAEYQSRSESGKSLSVGLVGWTINKYGTYKFVFRDRDLPDPVEQEITVVPPPPEQTSGDCL